MDELSDNNLKKAFSKLRGFESQQEGASWSSIEKAIEGNQPSRIGYALSLVALLLFMFPSSVDDLKGENTSSAPLTVESNQIAENHSVVINQDSKNTEEETSAKAERLARSKEIDVLIVQNSTASTSFENETTRNQNALLAKRTADFPVTASITMPIQYEIISTTELAEKNSVKSEEENKARRLELGLAGVYQFGVVDPIPTDNKVLDGYSSGPGYGLKGELIFPAAIGRRKLDLSFTYSFIYKKMDFSFEEYGPESMSTLSETKQTFSHVLGAGVSYPIRGGWNAAAHINYNLGNTGMHLQTGRMFLSASLQKNFLAGRSRLYLGATGGLPLTGTFQYFKYYPLQVYLGYKIKH